MGWLGRLLAGFLGLASLGIGLWPVGILFLLYLLISFRHRGSSKAGARSGGSVSLPRRYFVGFLFFAFSAVAFASGGSYSPIVLFIIGALVLSWPKVGPALPFAQVVPIDNSVLLRSKYSPLAWHAVAELKPGPEPFPRALSSISGRLAVFTDTGKTYLIASCFALGRKDAESRLLFHLRSQAIGTRGGAYLLPLDTEAAASIFRLKLTRMKPASADFVEYSSRVSGVLSLDCVMGRVARAQFYEIDGPASSARPPSRGSELDSPPLLWEVLDFVGKRTRWPDPDTLSNLLDSLAVTRGVPLAERFRMLQGSGNNVTIQSLGGAEVSISRPQLRAMVSIYS